MEENEIKISNEQLTIEQTGTVLEELIYSLKNQKRPETIDVPIYGKYSSRKRTFLYSDAQKEYDIVETPRINKEVRSVKAFALSIKEELKRRCNSTGEKSTVKVNLSGGDFIPDDDFEDYKITFNRLNSQQWNVVKRTLNRSLDHRDFLLFLQSLKPSFSDMGIDFHTLFASFSTLRLLGRSEITSNPIITENGQTQGYKCTYKLDNGCDGEETFPSGFSVKVPFAKAGDFKYEIPIDLLFTRDEDNQLVITVLCPEFEHIEEQAIIDEANYIREQSSQLADILILADF